MTSLSCSCTNGKNMQEMNWAGIKRVFIVFTAL